MGFDSAGFVSTISCDDNIFPRLGKFIQVLGELIHKVVVVQRIGAAGYGAKGPANNLSCARFTGIGIPTLKASVCRQFQTKCDSG